MKKNQTSVKIKSKKPVLSKWGFTIVVSIVIFLLKGPLSIMLPGLGLDQSWVLGLFWAMEKGLAWGSELAFTYGPLHFLSHGPMNIGDLSSFKHDCLIYLIVYFLVILIMVYQFAVLFYRQSWKTYSLIDKLLFIGGLLFFTFMKMHMGETILIINCILFIRLIFEIDCTKTNRKAYWGNIFLNIALLNVLCMTKFTYAIAACTLLILACAGLIYKKKAMLIACILPLFILLNGFFWVLCGQALSTLPSYYIHGFEISAGYTEAMSTHNPDIEWHYGLLSLLVAVFVGAFSLWFFLKKNIYHASVLFILLPVLFLALKEGYTRADHALSFFFQMISVVLFLILFSIGKTRLPYKYVWQVFIVIIATGTVVALSKLESQISSTIKTQKTTWMHLLSPKTARISQAKAAIRTSLPPLSKEYLEQANGKTVDIFPWEISLLYAYDLDWSPRPVLQSYSAYTSKLDSLNANHFKGSEAPDHIIYQYGFIDGRYLLFDEPATFRTILENYELFSPENYLILQRRQEEIIWNYTPLANGMCPVGTEIEVPQLPGQHIYCNIDLSLSFFGKVMNLFYKPAILYVCFHIKGASQPVIHRFLRQTAANGIFVSKYAGNLFDIYQIIRREYVQNIEKIQILTNHPEHYAPEMKYEFYSASLSE